MKECGRGGGLGGGIGDLCQDGVTPVGRVANDNDLVVTLTRGELVMLLRETSMETARQVAAALSIQRPLVVDRPTLALQLGCSPAHIDGLRKHGLPTLMVGQSVRFESQSVLAWLRERSNNHGA